MSDNEQDELKDGDESSQQTPLSSTSIVDLFDKAQLNLVNKMLPPKWFTRVKIFVSLDCCFDKIFVSLDCCFDVIAMTDSGVDMNSIQEELIPSKYLKNLLKS